MPSNEPQVAVIIPALNVARKDRPRPGQGAEDGRFEAMVVDDGSTDGTGDEARDHGAEVVVRHEVRSGVGAAIGGAGFVGSAVTRRLVDAGGRVTVLDDLFIGRADAVPTGAEYVEGSVTDLALVDELVAANSLIFHMAARNIVASTANRAMTSPPTSAAH